MGLNGFVARVLSFTRAVRNGARVSDTKSNPGGGANVTSEHFADAGDDSYPLDTDYVYSAKGTQAGRFVAVGYLDPKNTPKAQKGEKRIYARDPATGSAVVDLWLQNDGTAILGNGVAVVTLSPNGSILGSNSAGQFELEAGGDFVANGAKMTTDGDVVTSDGVSLRNHPHNQANDSAGDVQQPTGAPVATE